MLSIFSVEIKKLSIKIFLLTIGLPFMKILHKIAKKRPKTRELYGSRRGLVSYSKVNLCVNLIRFIRFLDPTFLDPFSLHVKRFFQNLPLSPFDSFTFLHIPLVIQNLLIDATLLVAFVTCHMFTCSTFYFIWNILLLEYSCILYILIWFH